MKPRYRNFGCGGAMGYNRAEVINTHQSFKCIYEMIFIKKLAFALFLIAAFACQERMVSAEAAVFTETKYETQDRKYVTGKVTRIADGDTFTMIFDNGFEVRVRLLGIDSPERRQAFSNRAKQTLSDLIYNKEVKVYYESKDRYGRVLGDIYIDDLNINQEMVRLGMAWHFIRYSDDETLAALEKEARLNKIGLWVDPSPVAPWEFRSK